MGLATAGPQLPSRSATPTGSAALVGTPGKAAYAFTEADETCAGAEESTTGVEATSASEATTGRVSIESTLEKVHGNAVGVLKYFLSA